MEVSFIVGGNEDELVDVLIGDLVKVSEREADGRQKGGCEVERQTAIIVAGLRQWTILKADSTVGRRLIVVDDLV